VPVSKGPSAQRALVVALAGVLAGVMLLLFVVWLVGRSDSGVDIRLGDDQFRSIDARRQSAVIDRGGPVLYPDVAGGDRAVYVQHLGDDPLRGWLAFDARRPGETRPACTLRWDAARSVFTDPCDPSATIPANGTGLRQYVVTVDDDGRVIIDLNADPATTTTTTTPSTTRAAAGGTTR
jgi:hypothetical protein